ncbi:MAG: zeta toxin family protein [Verrucomicrobiota bacterium]
MESSAPLLILLAGSNGSGKSTFHERFLQSLGLPFINPDLIAKEEFGEDAAAHAMEAAELASEARHAAVAGSASFIFETVFSDPVGDKVAFCEMAKAKGYLVDAHFIGLASPLLSRARVMQRVAQGGHNVPDAKIESRYTRTLQNLELLIPVADRLTLYDNSTVERPYRPVAYFENGVLVELSQEIPPWADFLELPDKATESTRPIE